jgi:prepilin-type N-terminal cleavage/methylation domain-containing protein
MLIKRFKSEAGYSLVEVMVAIMILAVAIIPMVSMFDAGLNAAVRGSNYDRARALAKKQMESVQTLSYDVVKNTYPGPSCTPAGFSGGESNTTGCTVPAAQDPKGVFSGFTYEVRKQYVTLPLGGAGVQALANSATDTSMLRVTITVRWGTNSYSISSIKAR